MILLVEIYKQSKRVHKTLKQKSQTKLSSLSEKRSVLVAEKIEIPNHPIHYLFEIEVFTKTYSTVLIQS